MLSALCIKTQTQHTCVLGLDGIYMHNQLAAIYSRSLFSALNEKTCSWKTVEGVQMENFEAKEIRSAKEHI